MAAGARSSARPQVHQQTNNAHSDSDSDYDTEPDTPRPNRQGLKKRLSEAPHNLDNDQSFSSDTANGRAPLKSVNINDDAAEKRRRRKSAKIAAPTHSREENAEAGPSGTSDGHAGSGEASGESSRNAGQSKQKQPLVSVAQVPVINVPLDVMSSNFEEWMKMATDNKINAANSWNFALIDYFHDMSLLRNTTDNSINFQRASCTLDGCVKIWTSRVDSVGTETGKLLSNLASEGQTADSDEEAAGSDNEGAEGQESGGKARKAKAHRHESTLAKNAAQLRSKKLELEFSVDPLFKKTCADFDEGGAQGLLMNHLSLGVGREGAMRVIFDASDAMGKRDDDEEEEAEPEEEVDLSHVRREFLPDLSILDDKAISYSLVEFSFSKDSFSFDETTLYRGNTRPADDAVEDEDDNELGHYGDGGVEEAGAAMDLDGPPVVEDFFQGDQAVGEDYGDSPLSGPDEFGGDDAEGGGTGGGSAENGATGARPDGFAPFDPRRAPTERDIIMAMTDADGEGMMDYFDQNFMKNWAGPEHWKLRKVVRRPDAETQKDKPRKEKKEAFKIDFLAPSENDLKERAKDMFAPVTRGAGINLPGPSAYAPNPRKRRRGRKEKEKKDDHLLPDDMHFSSRQLVTLFLKPKFSLKRARLNENGDGEVDENFWAQAAADQAAGRRGSDEGDDTANDGSIPFNTQFFHDEYDDDGPGFDDGYEGEGVASASVEPGEEQDLLAATQGQSRRVRPETVNYTKRAKRVDVRKLKENIWKGLKIVVPEKKEDEDEEDAMDMDQVEPPATDPSEARVFNNVISDLQATYPKDKMSEISTSFCFICLLHLANERGLKIEGGLDGQPIAMAESEREDEEGKKIGNIWDLKVYRDPDAIPSA